jgi:hypothetical protein
MNTSTLKRPSSEFSAVRCVLAGMMMAVLLPFSAIVGAEDVFQMKVLFNPSSSQLKAEARGRVMIYDGLDNNVVERALDEQFDRIEHMMFVRTRNTEPDGEVSYDDDGCD